MKSAKKTTISISIFLFLLSISTAQAAIPEWGVRGGDIIRWDASTYQENNHFTLEMDWYTIFTVDGFPESNGYYINGSVNQNGTLIDSTSLNSFTLNNLGPSSGSFVGPVLGYENIEPILLTDSASLVNLKAGIENFIALYSPYYTFNEVIPNELYSITGEGIDGSYVWNYTGMVNYTSDRVLFSVDEYYHHNDTSSGFIEVKQYQWKRTSYIQGTGDFPPIEREIPGYVLSVTLGAVIIGIAIIIRKIRQPACTQVCR